jgi:hypothetical protein
VTWRGQKILELMHPALLRSSGWKYSGRARDLMAAHWAGILDRFDDLPHYKRVDVVALYEVSWRMDAVNAHEAAERSKRAAKPGKKRGRGRR